MFSTKRLGLLLAALLVATMSFGVITSGAWFTDTDNVGVTTASSGGISIEANPTSFSVTGLMPGVWSAATQITIYNDSNPDATVKYRITDEFLSQSIAGFYDQIRIRIGQVHCGGTSPANTPVEVAVKSLNVTSAASLHPAGLPDNITHCYLVEFKLADGAGNEFQHQEASFNLVIDATQPENPGWSQ